ncbi:unnamed protein product, partial [Rotaria socialis]
QIEEDLQRQYQYVLPYLNQKEICLVTLKYQNSNAQQRHADEIYLREDQLKFKSKRYRNETKLKLKFYINDIFEDEIIACCEHRLIHRNRHNHLFHIQDIFGSKPCYKFLAKKLDKLRCPPQISTMLSINESLDMPSTNIHEQTNESLCNTLLNNRNFSDAATNVNFVSDQNAHDILHRTSEYSRSLSSNIETNSNEQDSSLSFAATSNAAMVNDVTQIIRTRLRIMQQNQTFLPRSAPREKGNVECFILVYLHFSHPDEPIIKKFCSLVNFFKFFKDIDDCVAFINSVSNEKIVFIVSKSFCDSILLRIENLQQILTIYILCEGDIEMNSSFKMLKVQGLYPKLNDIYEQISKDMHTLEHSLLIYLNLSTNTATIEQDYVYFQLLTELILDRNEISNGLQELINF